MQWMTLFQALIMRAAEICTLCPMKTIRLINGWTYFPLPSIPAISFPGPFSARWTDSFSLSWQAFTSFYKIRPAANSDWLDRSVQFKCPQRKKRPHCNQKREKKKKKAREKKKKIFACRTFYSRKLHLVIFSQISSRTQLQRMCGERCVIQFLHAGGQWETGVFTERRCHLPW